MVKKANKRVVIADNHHGLNGIVPGVSHASSDDHGRDHVAGTFLARHSKSNLNLPNSPQPNPHPKMSVSLNPSSSLGFKRPLTTLVKRSLTITNNNPQPVAFKVKTTAPKLYCVRPNSGRVEPGESVDVSVMLQALKEEPPLNTKCKDKFLIQSTIITPDKENLTLHDLWMSPEVTEDGKVFQQKLRVTYLPAEGQALEEEDENQVGMASILSQNDSHYETVHPPRNNGHISLDVPQQFQQVPSQESHETRPATPPQEDAHRHDTSYEPEQHSIPTVVVEPEEHYSEPPAPAPVEHVPVERQPTPELQYEQATAEQSVEEPAHEPPAPILSIPPAPAASAPPPEPIIITRENPVNEEMFARYKTAQAEIERLKAQVNDLVAQQELRRRTRKLSDADSATASDFQTVVEEPHIQPEGVPLQVVVIIALGVFVTTYLFF